MFILKLVAFGLGFVVGFALLSVVALPVSPVIGGAVAGIVLSLVP